MILEPNMIFNDYTLNVFTDASVTKRNGITYSAPGYYAVIGTNVENANIIYQDCIVIKNSTNNEGEIYAIYMALQKILDILKLNKNIKYVNLYSDSKISVLGLRSWIYGWIKHAKDGYLYNSSGDLVSNQSIFMSCIYLILDNKLNINILHVNGHGNINNKDNIIKYRDSFKDVNKIKPYIGIDFAKILMNYNNYIDDYTRTSLLNFLNNNIVVNSMDYKNDTLVFQTYNKNIYGYSKLLNKQSKYFIY